MSAKRIPLRSIVAISFLATMMILVTASLPRAFAHGVHQPPLLTLAGKKSVPEFPLRIAAVAAALAIGATIAARRTSIFAGKTY